MININDSLEESFLLLFKELFRSTQDKKHPFRYFSLCTVNDDGSPNSRTVVLRKKDQDNRLWVYTDSRSLKFKELKNNNKATLLFYHPIKKLQLKLLCTSNIHYQDNVCKQAWQTIDDSGKLSYNTVLNPGRRITRPEQGHEFLRPLNDLYFSVLIFDPTEIELLQLNRSAHLRAKSVKFGGKWTRSWLVP